MPVAATTPGVTAPAGHRAPGQLRDGHGHSLLRADLVAGVMAPKKPNPVHLDLAIRAMQLPQAHTSASLQPHLTS